MAAQTLTPITLDEAGIWLITVESSIDVSGAVEGIEADGLPFVKIDVGSHGSTTVIPMSDGTYLWTFSFQHTVSSAPETLTASADSGDLNGLSIAVSSTLTATKIGAEADDNSDATARTIKAGSFLNGSRHIGV